MPLLPSRVAITCAGLAITSLGFAQTAPVPAEVLSRDELRVCMQQEDELGGRSRRLDGQFQSSNDEAASIALANAGLLRESAAGFKDRAAREAYAVKAKVLEQRIHAHNRRVKDLKLSLADLQVAQAANMRACGGRSYMAEDKEAIAAEKTAATASAPAASR